MIVYTYDGSFDGFLSCVFECYNRKEFPVDICYGKRIQKYPGTKEVYIQTKAEKASRVWKGIQNKLDEQNKHLLFYAFLSEDDGIELKIYRFLRRLFAGQCTIETTSDDKDVFYLIQQSQEVKKEAKRAIRFLRFERSKKGLYFLAIQPHHNILPLLAHHYQHRFAGKQWLIFDLNRGYGIFCDLLEIHEIEFQNKNKSQNNTHPELQTLKTDEEFYNRFSRLYQKNFNVEEIKNLRLQVSSNQRRFLNYLPGENQ